MLKEKLERIIYEKCPLIEPARIQYLAQAIIDRLEIDEDRLKDFIFNYAYKHPTEMAYCINDSEFVKRIAKIKPIKLKESDK